MSQSATSLGSLSIQRERFELPGGAVLLVSPRPHAPVTAVQIHMRGGLHMDPAGREGMAEWVGQFLQQGTTSKDEAAIAECIEPFGGSVAGNANGLRGTMAGDRWRELLDIMVELVSEPAFPDGPVQVQMERTKSHLRVQEEEPRVQGGRLFRNLIYGDHRYGQPTAGTVASLQAISAADLRAHHAEHWGSARAIIAVCGDVQAEEVYEHLRSRMGGWNVGSARPALDDRFPEVQARCGAFEKGREQVHIYFGHLGVPRSVPDYASLVVMDHVLGSGPGFVNRLSKKLRDEQGLAYSVHGDIHHSAGLLPGMFTAYIGTSPEHLEQAVRGIQNEVRTITQEPVGAEELQMAKDYVTGSMVLGYERASRRASSLVAHEIHGFPVDHLDRLRRAYGAVTAEEVLASAQAHLFPERACLAASGSVTQADLEALHPAG